MCGEKLQLYATYFAILGSPPRVRGKVKKKEIYLTGTRITPACAGKSLFDVVIDALCEDHPRVCGEK